MTGLLAIIVFTPLFAAILTFAHYKYANTLCILCTLVVATAALTLMITLPVTGIPLIAIAGWEAPLGIQWRVDGLAVLMLTLTGMIALAVSLYASGYFAGHTGARYFWPLWMLMLAGLNALFVSGDLFNLYVTLEILGLSAVALVTLANTGTADRAAFRYILVSLLGSLLYLAGVALLYRTYGTLDILTLKFSVQPEPATWVALALMFTGLLLKSAIFPLHFWLPPAHANAPAPVSALLSALVVKGSFFIVLRLWQDVMPALPTDAIGLLLGLTGTAAILWGSICALYATRLKLLVAYSTVAQLGYLMLFFPLSNDSSVADTAFAGVVYFIIAHAFAKAAMFMAAGNLQYAAGHDEIDRLAPAARQLSMTMFVFALAGASIMGLPPSGGFIAKWTLLNAAFNAGQWFWMVVLVAGGLLSAAYIFRVLVLAFQTAPQTEKPPSILSVNPVTQWAPLGLAIIAIALGFNALPALNVLQIDAVIAGSPLTGYSP